MKYKLIISFLLMLVCLSLASCGSLEQGNPANSTALFTPKVTGMWLTNNCGSVLGISGNPDSSTAPYPNPFIDWQVIPVPVPKDSSTASIWIVPAVGPDDDFDGRITNSGATIFSPLGKPVAEFLLPTLDSGTFLISWDAKDLPAGYYRVYMLINTNLVWIDVYHTLDDSELLPHELCYLEKDNFQKYTMNHFSALEGGFCEQTINATSDYPFNPSNISLYAHSCICSGFAGRFS